METGFWLERWQQGEIGFHQDRPHPALTADRMSDWLTPGTQVFLPLCGKTPDLDWFQQQGLLVAGIDISRLAIEQYIESHPLDWSLHCLDDIREYTCTAGHRLWCGDFFDLAAQQLTTTRLIYDRAALIALPPETRQRYASRLQNLLPEADVLLITLEYDATEMEGPPFPVREHEVRELFPGYQLECQARQDVLTSHESFMQRGLSGLTEAVYILRPQP